MTVVVGYHYPCLDGLCAAWMVREKLKKAQTSFRFIPLSQNESINANHFNLRGTETFYLLDFATSRSLVVNLSERCKKLIIIDHHITAQEALTQSPLPDNVEFHYDGTKCAATLVLDVLGPLQISNKTQRFLKFVEDSDLFRMALPSTPAFRAGIHALNLQMDIRKNPRIFEMLRRLDLDAVLRRGRQIAFRQCEDVNRALRQAFKVHLGGRGSKWGVCLAVQGNEFGRLRSAIGNKLAETSHKRGFRGIGIVAYQEKQQDPTMLKLSLRSIDSETTTDFTVAFGGGGHVHASSCNVDIQTFNEWKLNP